MSGIEEVKQRLKKEIDELNHELKVELPKRIQEAREYGDLKENAEYHAARERQGFVKARIGQLSNQMSQLSELNLNDVPEDRIGFGSRVTVIDTDSDDEIEFTLVSPGEVDPSQGKISLSSPIGGALQDHRAGDRVEVQTPAGKKNYFVTRLETIHGQIFEEEYEE